MKQTRFAINPDTVERLLKSLKFSTRSLVIEANSEIPNDSKTIFDELFSKFDFSDFVKPKRVELKSDINSIYIRSNFRKTNEEEITEKILQFLKSTKRNYLELGSVKNKDYFLEKIIRLVNRIRSILKYCIKNYFFDIRLLIRKLIKFLPKNLDDTDNNYVNEFKFILKIPHNYYDEKRIYTRIKE